MRLKTLLVFILLLLVPVQAQLLTVTGEFRIVKLSRDQQRIGVARVEDDPRVRQNWIYIKHDTIIHQKIVTQNGETKEIILDRDQLWEAMKPYIGKVMKVHGGRDWNGTIDAKDIWF